jgi:hypothetical protein
MVFEKIPIYGKEVSQNPLTNSSIEMIFIKSRWICFDKLIHSDYALSVDLFTDGLHKTTEGDVSSVARKQGCYLQWLTSVCCGHCFYKGVQLGQR